MLTASAALRLVCQRGHLGALAGRGMGALMNPAVHIHDLTGPTAGIRLSIT